MRNYMKSPFPYFGGKSSVSQVVWERFGKVDNYVEPFFGSGAILLSRPEGPNLKPVEGFDDHIEWGTETVNDINGWVTNFWRSTQVYPELVAKHCDWPVSELDLHARADWLFYRKGVNEWIEKMRSDPDFCDPKSAGWWLYGKSSWIGGAFVQQKNKWKKKTKISRQRPQLGNKRHGVYACLEVGETVEGYLKKVQKRIRDVRICCGDWKRVLTGVGTTQLGVTAVFLDPPYGVTDRDVSLYGTSDSVTIAPLVGAWCKDREKDERFRIAVCGYEGEYKMLDGWSVFEWKASGGMGNQAKEGPAQNCKRERIWFSPSCLQPFSLFDSLE
jgi:DNA adenine methylase